MIRGPFGWLSVAISCVGAYAAMKLLKAWCIKTFTSVEQIKRRRREVLTGKVVLITGASSGLGRALAMELFGDGAHVILAARSIDKLRALCHELVQLITDETGKPPENQCHFRYLDLADENSIEAGINEMFAIFGRIDILINNAGASYRGTIANTEVAVHRQLMETNYFGHVNVTKALLNKILAPPQLLDAALEPKQAAEPAGDAKARPTKLQIVAISSIQGRISLPHRSAYAASKHAFQAFFDCLRAEAADSGVEVLVVSPGYIKTNLSLSALTQSVGRVYGRMDETTRNGIEPNVVAGLIVDAVVEHKKELIVVSDLKPRLAIVLRCIAPQIYFWLMLKRARIDRQIAEPEQHTT